LPESELHETTLLFANYQIRLAGFKTYYLGQNLPFDDVAYLYRKHKPEFILTVVTTNPGPADIQNYVDKMCSGFAESQLLLTGYQIVGQDLKLGENARVLTTLNQLSEILNSLKSEKE
jgi:methanogenic corrinoid protein MtbC1